MNNFTVKRSTRVLYVVLFAFFILNKTVFRPWILKHDFPEVVRIFTLSVPNFIEAVMGTVMLCLVILFVRSKTKFLQPFSEGVVYFVAILFASFYVTTQELKIHNLGGRNTYDPYDLLASIVGLSFVIGWILFKGLVSWQK